MEVLSKDYDGRHTKVRVQLEERSSQFIEGMLNLISEPELDIDSVKVTFVSDWDYLVADKEFDNVDEFIDNIANIMEGEEDVDYINFSGSVRGEELYIIFYFSKYRICYHYVEFDLFPMLQKYFE